MSKLGKRGGGFSSLVEIDDTVSENDGNYQPQSKVQKIADSDPFLRLNVGGTIMQVKLSTLSKVPGSVLHNKFKIYKNQKSDRTIDVDRNSQHFENMINYLRNGL